jgi:hypothetical protein
MTIMTTKPAVALAVLLACAGFAGTGLAFGQEAAQSATHDVAHELTQNPKPYAGQHQRPLKALSEQEIADYRAGKGLGFSKVAELNSMPGPAHVIELADKLGLDPSQREATRKLFERMQADAVKLGHRFIENEQRLQAAVLHGARDETVQKLIAESASLQGQIRAVHVMAHLDTTELLSASQVKAYDEARGYGTKAGQSERQQQHRH